MSQIRRYDAYVFDLDGTVYLGESLIPGADTVIRTLREDGRAVLFVTNKPIASIQDYVEKLRRLGIPTKAEDVVSSVDALVAYLQRHAAGARLLILGEEPVIAAVQTAGFEVVVSASEADVVVVSYDRAFDFEKLREAFLAIKNYGARLIATNPDAYCPTDRGGDPDCGALLSAIEIAAGATAEAVVGKPSAHMARLFTQRLGIRASATVIVGDRLDTDIAMATVAGMDSALVLSGVSAPDAVGASDIVPTYVMPDLNGLLGSVSSEQPAAAADEHCEQGERP